MLLPAINFFQAIHRAIPLLVQPCALAIRLYTTGVPIYWANRQNGVTMIDAGSMAEQNITVTTKTSNGAITFDSHTTGVGMWNYEHVSSYHNPSNGQFIIYGTTTFNYGVGRITYNVKITGEIKSGSPAINSISYSF